MLLTGKKAHFLPKEEAEVLRQIQSAQKKKPPSKSSSAKKSSTVKKTVAPKKSSSRKVVKKTAAPKKKKVTVKKVSSKSKPKAKTPKKASVKKTVTTKATAKKTPLLAEEKSVLKQVVETVAPKPQLKKEAPKQSGEKTEAKLVLTREKTSKPSVKKTPTPKEEASVLKQIQKEAPKAKIPTKQAEKKQPATTKKTEKSLDERIDETLTRIQANIEKTRKTQAETHERIENLVKEAGELKRETEELRESFTSPPPPDLEVSQMLREAEAKKKLGEEQAAEQYTGPPRDVGEAIGQAFKPVTDVLAPIGEGIKQTFKPVDQAIKSVTEPVTSGIREWSKQVEKQAIETGKTNPWLGGTVFIGSVAGRMAAGFVEGAASVVNPVAWVEGAETTWQLITNPEKRGEVTEAIMKDPGVMAEIVGGVAGGYATGKLIGAGISKIGGKIAGKLKKTQVTTETKYYTKTTPIKQGAKTTKITKYELKEEPILQITEKSKSLKPGKAELTLKDLTVSSAKSTGKVLRTSEEPLSPGKALAALERMGSGIKASATVQKGILSETGEFLYGAMQKTIKASGEAAEKLKGSIARYLLGSADDSGRFYIQIHGKPTTPMSVTLEKALGQTQLSGVIKTTTKMVSKSKTATATLLRKARSAGAITERIPITVTKVIETPTTLGKIVGSASKVIGEAAVGAGVISGVSLIKETAKQAKKGGKKDGSKTESYIPDLSRSKIEEAAKKEAVKMLPGGAAKPILAESEEVLKKVKSFEKLPKMETPKTKKIPIGDIAIPEPTPCNSGSFA